MAIRKQNLAQTITQIATSVALMAVCSWISVPFFISFTMQSFGVFFISALMGWKKSVLAMLVYIALGICGAPVFSGFQSGAAHLAGATGGYIISFPVVALIIGVLCRLLGDRIPLLMLSMLIGIAVCYIAGTLWYVFGYTRSDSTYSFLSVLSYCVFPFIIPDILKSFLAAFLIRRIKPYIAKHAQHS